MNPFTIVYFGIGGSWQCFGAYSDWSGAIAAIAGVPNAQSYLVAVCYGPAVVGQSGPYSPQPLQPGAWVALLTTSGGVGNTPMIAYGTFSTFAAAQQWILAQTSPANFVAALINPAP